MSRQTYQHKTRILTVGNGFLLIHQKGFLQTVINIDSFGTKINVDRVPVSIVLIDWDEHGVPVYEVLVFLLPN